MPPGRLLNSPHCAKAYAIAIEPTAVTPQDSSDMAPTWAMFVGSMMIPEPIMLTATRTVSCIRLIFFGVSISSSPFQPRPLLLDAQDMVGPVVHFCALDHPRESGKLALTT